MSSDDTSVALISGAVRGLGLEVARELAGTGIRVIIASRNPADAAGVAREIDGAEALAVGLDVADSGSVEAAAIAVADDPGRLDILINNAAAYVDWTETATGADLETAADILQVNLFGAWRMTQAFLPLLLRSPHPRIVNVSSGGGSHADDQFGLTKRHGAAATYGISKAALNALTATLAAELAETPVLVNAVCPGLTATWPGADQMGARPVEQSAPGVAWAATLPDDGPRGGLFRDRVPLGW